MNVTVASFDTEDNYSIKDVFVIDLDNNKTSICYRSRVSFNCFFNATKKRNVNKNIIYKEIFVEYRSNNKDFLNIKPINLTSIWNFYNYIKYDYKNKKFLQ